MEKLRSFNVDFNWMYGTFSPADAFARADAAKLAQWYQDMGCSNFWTFAVSYNGRAWYDSRLCPKVQGLEGNFTRACVEEGHKRGMSVFAYHCLAANPEVEAVHPEWDRKNPGDMFHLILCDEYVDWFCRVLQESITQCGYDGVVIDWFRCPQNRLPQWIPAEIQLYEQIMGESFPETPTKAQVAEFEKRCIERAWDKVRAAVRAVSEVPIWTNHPFDFVENPVWNGNRLLKEVDFVLNECPDVSYLSWLRREAGPHTRVVQNICGWRDHDLSGLTPEIISGTDLFGFAAANPDTCMPFDDTDIQALKASGQESRYGWDETIMTRNRQNILGIQKLFRSLQT